jgi:NADH dehydrogenase
MILVVGATGLLGGGIAQHLLLQGQPVRILVRRNSLSEQLALQGMATSAKSLIDAGAQPICGDLKDRASLDAACAGIDTLITTANAVLRGGPDTIESVDLQGTMNLIDAAKAAGVKHFIYTSVPAADADSPVPLNAAKAKCEKYLKESGLSYTILKPGVFMEIWIGAVVGIPLRAGQPVTLVNKGATKVPFVAMPDVAAYAIVSTQHPAAKNAEIYIAAPRAYTWTEAAEAAGHALGATLSVNYVPLGTPVPLLPDAMQGLIGSMEMQDWEIPMAETSKTFGIEPTSMDAFAQRFFRQPA